MDRQTSEALLSMFDSAPLNRRYWTNFSLLALITVLEFFDFLIVGFLSQSSVRNGTSHTASRR
jgi:hypothetical protein